MQLARYLMDPLGHLQRTRARYGPVFTTRWPGMPPTVYFTEPAAIQALFRASPDVLQGGRGNSVLDFIIGPRTVARLDGAAHGARRRAVVPPFARLAGSYAATMATNAERRFDTAAGAPVSFREISQALTLRNLIDCTLGIDDRVAADRMHALMTTFIRESLAPFMAAAWTLLPGVALRRTLVRTLGSAGRLAGWLPFATLARTIRELDEVLYDAIARARARPLDEPREDVLSLLVRMEGSLSDDDLRDELMAILVAGHETSSTTMDWFVVEARSRPEVWERLRAEVDAVVGDGPVTAAHTRQLSYLRAVISECLRLRPPVPAVGRYVAQPTVIAGVPLPAGILASPSIALVHRDPTVWRDPDAFRPERFDGATIVPGSYIPFGGGGRTCLGKPFGMFQLQVVLATLIARFDLEAASWPPPKLMQRGLFTGVNHPIVVRCHRRAQPRSQRDAA